ncbi:MAG: hypothetical protein J6W38_04780 [Prevotella sp.]|nr:hypothetical protein [Prevotella sp.]
MATRKIKDIIADMRAAANDDGKDFATLAEKTNERALELEAILAKDKADFKFAIIAMTLALLFVIAFAYITDMYNDDLREDVIQKKEIITKYEQATKHDTIHTYVNEDGKEITVPSLLDDNMKLMNKISILELEKSISELKLDMIKKKYGIEVVQANDEVHIEAKEVDSAKLLLPVFRDRLKYDSIKGQWTVTRRVVQVGDKTYPE